VTERGSLLVTGYNLTQVDLTSVNGSADGWIYNSLFFEIDIESKEILFQWSALETRIPISNTKQSL
jgi:Arylsulfotransferase (ASST)